jgi:hypothetical protein
MIEEPSNVDDSDEVHTQLVTHIASLETNIADIRKNLVKTIAMSVITILIVLGISIWYAGHVRSVSDQRWCTLMVSLDDRQQQIKNAPGTTKEQRQFIDNVHNLRADLGCNSRR